MGEPPAGKVEGGKGEGFEWMRVNVRVRVARWTRVKDLGG
jgi:hypothetical protein